MAAADDQGLRVPVNLQNYDDDTLQRALQLFRVDPALKRARLLTLVYEAIQAELELRGRRDQPSREANALIETHVTHLLVSFPEQATFSYDDFLEEFRTCKEWIYSANWGILQSGDARLLPLRQLLSDLSGPLEAAYRDRTPPGDN